MLFLVCSAKALADKSEEARRRRKQDVLDNFRRLYGGGVYGRLVQLCQPVHARYQLAVTRLLGQYMEVGRPSSSMMTPSSFLTVSDVGFCLPGRGGRHGGDGEPLRRILERADARTGDVPAAHLLDGWPLNASFFSVVPIGNRSVGVCGQVKPLQERLRLIKEPANVRLVFDVLSFEPAEVRR